MFVVVMCLPVYCLFVVVMCLSVYCLFVVVMCLPVHLPFLLFPASLWRHVSPSSSLPLPPPPTLLPRTLSDFWRSRPACLSPPFYRSSEVNFEPINSDLLHNWSDSTAAPQTEDMEQLVMPTLRQCAEDKSWRVVQQCLY